MPVFTVRHPRTLASVVLSLRDCFKVCWIDAERVVTGVVNHEPIRDRSDVQRVGVTVGPALEAYTVDSPHNSRVLGSHCSLHMNGAVPAAFCVHPVVGEKVSCRSGMEDNRVCSHTSSLPNISRGKRIRSISFSKARPVFRYVEI